MIKMPVLDLVARVLGGGAFCLAFGLLAMAEDPFASAIRPTEALSPEEEQRSLHVPEGFRLQLFASEPEILKPINMAFDERGRLWVSCTQDYPFVNLEQPGDSIRILEDTDGDGRADRVTTFVDGITHPMGLLPYKDGVIAFSIPNIEFFRDTDGDGKCDERKVLYGPFDYSRDTHGLNNGFRRGYDGWVYACHGFSNRSVVKGPDGHVLDVSSGSIYRFRPDGSRIERYTFGQVNPFGMTFDAQGDLFSSDCHTKPLMLMIRDGQYPGFGRPHDGLGFAPEILKHSHGSTAIAGVTRGSDERFPEGFRDNFFVGNVMTSRVNRNSLKITGSSMKAVEEPDFVISDDPWFRPVDLQMGPDGALYVADFYNKIIGHYEVPLKHPERDRTRGRIWRIVPAELAGTAKAGRVDDLSECSVAELLQAAETSNVPRQIQVLDEISDRLGKDAIEDLQQQLETDLPERSHVIALWGLHRLQALPFEELRRGLLSPVSLVRIHSQRILADRANWSAEESAAALTGLQDANPFVQRAAADALARHSAVEHVRPLLDAWQAVSKDDPVLEYQLKLAVRNQFQRPGTFPKIFEDKFSERDRQSLAVVALGLAHPDAALALLELSRTSGIDHLRPLDVVDHIARWGTPEQISQLADWIREKWKDDVPLQIRLIGAVRNGLRKQGIEQTELLHRWGIELVSSILHAPAPSVPVWESAAQGEGGDWDYEWRKTSDGARVRMLSSFPGGEKSMSVLRSPPFTIPAELTFLICGHLGPPDQAAQEKSYVRLCLVDGDQEIARQLPPRGDAATRIQWDLTPYRGQEGYLEAVDGLNLKAYAWLAIGGIDPAVLRFPETGVPGRQPPLDAAMQLIREFELRQFRDELIAFTTDLSRSRDLRNAALETVSRWDSSPVPLALAAIWKLDSLTPEQRESLLQAIVQGDAETRFQQLKERVKPLPAREQVEIAQTLLSRGGGDAILLDLCDSGCCSPRILLSSTIRPALEQAGRPGIQERTRAWIESLPSGSAELDALIATLKAKSSGRKADPALGRRVFEDRCAACHQIQGVGKVIGPQLDGIGNRGLERLLEDVLDPNRNVDEAFRSRTYALSDGRVLSGMLRRQEGALLVIADNKGEELRFAADAVDQEAISRVSIMPDNWKDLIPESDLLDLFAFLSEQKK